MAPTHYKIFDYWKDKSINHKYKIISQHEYEDGARYVVMDWGEPECWACGKPFLKIPDYENKLKSCGLDSIWDDKYIKSNLQRCHIVAKQLGGGDSVENLFLMCEDCHFESPDTKYPQVFFAWVVDKKRNSNPYNALWKQLQETMRQFNINEKKFTDYMNSYGIKKINYGYLKDKLGIQAGEISMSSKAGILVALYLQQNKNV